LKICNLLQQNNKLFYYFTAEHPTQLVKLTAEKQNFCYSSSNADSSAKAREATGIVAIGGHHCIFSKDVMMPTNIFVILI